MWVAVTVLARHVIVVVCYDFGVCKFSPLSSRELTQHHDVEVAAECRVAEIVGGHCMRGVYSLRDLPIRSFLRSNVGEAEYRVVADCYAGALY